MGEVRRRVPEELCSTMTGKYIEPASRCHGNELQRDLLVEKVDAVWAIISDAHENWRMQPDTKQLLRHSEECANWLNAGACLELAGGAVWNVWVARFLRRFPSLDLPFDQTLDITGFSDQMDWMEEISFSHSPLMSSIFVTKRRKFVEDKMLSGKGSLFRYMLDQHESEDQNFLYRQTRQIILANGGGAPIDW